jgi:hypothetical protein
MLWLILRKIWDGQFEEVEVLLDKVNLIKPGTPLPLDEEMNRVFNEGKLKAAVTIF